MTEEQERPARRWDPEPGDYTRIREHLARQKDLDPLRFVRLDDGTIRKVGEDAFGEEGHDDER